MICGLSSQDLPDALWVATETHKVRTAVWVRLETGFGRDNNLFSKWLQRFAGQLFIEKRAIDFRRVKKPDPALNCLAQ